MALRYPMAVGLNKGHEDEDSKLRHSRHRGHLTKHIQVCAGHDPGDVRHRAL